jgi:SAM-dependent methyltransferase
MSHGIRTIALAALLLCGAGWQAARSQSAFEQTRPPDVVYVGTPYDVVSRMIKLAGVNKKEVVFDLGCGDGRMVILAALKHGCRGIGYDIDPERVSTGLENVKRNGVGQLVKILQEDIFTVDLSAADVLLLYLLPEINQKLVPQFERLKPGSRIVTHDYDIDGYVADQSIRVTSNEDNSTHTLFLYTTPLKTER